MVRTGASKSVRHGKHYWRKGTRLDDIDHDLYMQREDERLGFVILPSFFQAFYVC
jgi:hypothetical protein